MIKKIKIENYKCFLEKEIDMNGLNFFAGANAVGKSSFIQAILIAKKSNENILKGQVFVNDIFGVNLGLPQNLIASNHTSEYICIGISNEDNIVENYKLCIDNEITNPFSFKIEKSGEKDVFDKGFIYLNAERVGPRIALDMSSNRELDLGAKGEYTNHVIKKADLLKIQISPEVMVDTLPRFSAQCEAWLNTIIPNVQFDISMNEDVNKSIIKYKNLNMSDNYYVPTATGFGITYVLPIITAGLLSTSNKGSILIVENPEAHLHPYGQSQLGKFLSIIAGCGVQVIIETHSEHIINGARLQLAIDKKTDLMKIFFFNSSNNKEQTQIQEISAKINGELTNWPRGFFDQNKKDLRELLELRCQK